MATRMELDYVPVVFVAAVDPGAAGWYEFKTLPEDEGWELIRLRAYVAAGAPTFSSFGFSSIEGSGSTYYLDTQTAAAAMLSKFDPPIPLKPGNTLKVYVAAYAGGDTISVQGYYKRTKFIQV